MNPQFVGALDKVICDVPCSGLGVAGRKPEILYRYDERTTAELTEKQAAIVKNALNYLKPGGKLIYSTCTLNKEENEAQIERLLKENPSLKPSPITLPFELKGPHPERREGMRMLNPAEDMTDGFFTATIEKPGNKTFAEEGYEISDV